jgi:uncharacterized protein (DUF302 family)
MITYGFVKEVQKHIEDAERIVREELQREGFGVLTRIDMSEKFKEKLGEDFRKYIILGACNPPNAFRSVCVEENIGLLLPCNVIIHEKGGKTILGIIKPTVAMSMVDNQELAAVASSVEAALKRVFDAVV